MALSRIFLIATALVAVLMIQCPLVVRSQFCDANYPNPQRLSIDGNVEVVDELFSLVDGLEAQRFVLFGNLRPEVSTTSPVLRTLIKNLAILNEHERRMDALLTLTEGQDDEELVVLRAVFRQLVDNACELFTNIYDTESECSYYELKKLKLKLDMIDATMSVQQSINSYLGAKVENFSSRVPDEIKWTYNVFACGITDEEFDIVGETFGIQKTCCSSKQ